MVCHMLQVHHHEYLQVYDCATFEELSARKWMNVFIFLYIFVAYIQFVLL
jgi:hypothetical protein